MMFSNVTNSIQTAFNLTNQFGHTELLIEMLASTDSQDRVGECHFQRLPKQVLELGNASH
jgi:hypothetical protein